MLVRLLRLQEVNRFVRAKPSERAADVAALADTLLRACVFLVEDSGGVDSGHLVNAAPFAAHENARRVRCCLGRVSIFFDDKTRLLNDAAIVDDVFV